MKRSIRNSGLVFSLLALPAGAAYAQAPVGTASQPATMDQRVERLERMMQSQGLLEILQQVQQLQEDISKLRGDIETQNYQLEQLTQRQRDLYADMDQRLQQLEGGNTAPATADGTAPVNPVATDTPPLETLSAIQDANAPSSSMTTDSPLQVEIVGSMPRQQAPTAINPATSTMANTTTPPANPDAAATNTNVAPTSVDPVQLQAEYQQAFNLLRQSLYDQAIKAFQQFLTAHPNDRYSDAAQYWLAEAFFVNRDFPQALDEYNKVVTNFPESPKASEAMLKIGFTMIELGQIDNARQHLQGLIRQQPDSTVARLADERLKQLGSATQQPLPEQAN